MRNRIAPGHQTEILSCDYFGVCGGCSFRDRRYEEQLSVKSTEVFNALADIPHSGINPIIPSPDTDYYRNKMEFAFGVWDDCLALGLRERKKFYHVVDLDCCRLMSEQSSRICATVRGSALKNNLPAFHRGRQTGLLRYLVIREGKMTGQCMVNLVTSPAEKTILKPIFNDITDAFPELTSLLWSVTSSRSDTAGAEKTEIISGKDHIEEMIGNLRFRISPYSFFQTNSRCAARLYDVIRDLAASFAPERILDLYCGAGGIGLYCAQLCRDVLGIELNPASIIDACENCRINNITNCSFHAARAEEISKYPLPERMDRVCAIVDPPRPGLGKELCDFLESRRPGAVIYVSCNPRALSSDLQRLTRFYKIKYVQPIDLFPHTPHVETVVYLVA